MVNKAKILGLIGISAKAGKVVSGTDACIEEITRKKCSLIIVSEEASEKTKKNFKYYADKYNIPIVIFGNIEELSHSIGKRNRAIICIKEKNLSNEIQKNINGGDIIG